jgi:DNA-binding LytR/AlgR family response regulator
MTSVTACEGAAPNASASAEPGQYRRFRVVARRKASLVFIDPQDIWAFEAAERLTFVHARQGRFDIDLSLAGVEASLGRRLVRVHRNWLVDIAFVMALERVDGETTLLVGDDFGPRATRVPVSRQRSKAVRALLLENAIGLRHPTTPAAHGRRSRLRRFPGTTQARILRSDQSATVPTMIAGR